MTYQGGEDKVHVSGWSPCCLKGQMIPSEFIMPTLQHSFIVRSWDQLSIMFARFALKSQQFLLD